MKIVNRARLAHIAIWAGCKKFSELQWRWQVGEQALPSSCSETENRPLTFPSEGPDLGQRIA